MNKKILFICFVIVAIFITIVILPKALSAKGKKCYKNGNMACAISCFKNAHMLMPMDLHYEYYLTKSLTKVKPTYKIQKELYNLSQKARGTNAKNLAANTLSYWKSSLIGKIGNNYIEQAPTDDDIVHWNKNSFPLNVYIHKETNIPEYYEFAISKALSLWTRSINFVNFKYTDTKSNAQIIIDIKPIPQDLCVNGVCKYVTAYTTPAISMKQLKSMTITLYDKDPTGNYYSENAMFKTVAHELGHALGIMGHSYNPSDMMYSTQHSATESDYSRSNRGILSANDINTLLLLYTLEPTVTDKPTEGSKLVYAPVILGSKDEMINRKITEAQNYIQRSPHLSTGYVELASAYLKKGKPKAAEENLLKALNYTKTSEETYMIYYNLAVVSCIEKQFNKAQTYVDKAKQIKNSPELSEIEYWIANKIVPSV